MVDSSRIAVAEVNVVIRAEDCLVTILPHLGGKIASIRVKRQELLQAPLLSYAPRTQTMPFDASDASGWDECLPSVAACSVETAAGQAEIPDHGDLWRAEWSESREQGAGSREWGSLAANVSSATLCGECFSLPLRLDRTATLAETEKGWRLSLSYKVTNTGNSPIPWSWAAHPLFAVEDGDRIVLPDSVHELRLEGSGGNRLGRNGDPVSWPIAALANGSQTDLSVAQLPESAIGDKLFAGPLATSENWCALERPNAGLRIKVGFDPTATPYLGLWLCYGGWPDRPGNKQMCVALEPSTAPVDSLAQTGPWSRILAPGDYFSWPMAVDIESL